MRMRKKKNLVPRMEACDACWIRRPEEHRGRWRELMPGARELRVELGCGKGRFTAETAKAEPDVLLIAVEKVPDAMVVAMERVRDAGLTNVFFIDADAALLPELFAPGEVDRIYINFCDPWPRSQPEKAPPDTRKLPAPVPQGAAPGGTDPLQDRQRQALRVVGRGDSAVRLFPLGGHDGSARGRPCRRDDGL